MPRRGLVPVSLATAAVVTAAAGVVTVVVRTAAAHPPAVGQIARLLDRHHADRVADAVTATSRASLSAQRLQSTWDALTRTTGPLSSVTRTLVVPAGNGRTDELEVLRFSGGYVGALSAQRVGAHITGLVLLGGRSEPTAATAAGAECALDLAGGRLSAVRAKFDKQMAAALSLDQLVAQTRKGISGLRPPAHVAAQVVASEAGYTIVETYLVYANGIRRVETTFGPDGAIAGLYMRFI
jgi:hypothetical protein